MHNFSLTWVPFTPPIATLSIKGSRHGQGQPAFLERGPDGVRIGLERVSYPKVVENLKKTRLGSVSHPEASRAHKGELSEGGAARADMPTLVTPEGRAYRIENKAQLEVFANGRTDIGYKLKGNISQLLGFDIIGSDRSGKHEASGFFCVEDTFTTWMYHDGMTVAIPLFGSAPQRFKQLQERASIQFSLPTFKRMVSAPGKRSEDGWWCGSPPAAVAAGLPDGASIYGIPKPATDGIGMPAAQGEVAVPDYGAAARSNLAPTDLVTAPERLVACQSGLDQRACATKLPQIKPWISPRRPPTPELSLFPCDLSLACR